jgi:hypothetical protein
MTHHRTPTPRRPGINSASATVSVGLFVLLVTTGSGLAQSSPFAAWGTGASAGRSPATQSNQLHLTERDQAVAAELGRYAANSLSGTACGACIYYTIQGNNNVISGNSNTLTNSGDVQGTAEFNFD